MPIQTATAQPQIEKKSNRATNHTKQQNVELKTNYYASPILRRTICLCCN